MKRHISISTFLLGVFAAVGPFGAAKAEISVWVYSTHRCPISIPGGTFDFNRKSANYSGYYYVFGGLDYGITDVYVPETTGNDSIAAIDVAGLRFTGWYTCKAGWKSSWPVLSEAEDLISTEKAIRSDDMRGAGQWAVPGSGGNPPRPTLIAKYVPVHTITAAVLPADAGTVSISGTNVLGTVDDGGSVTLKAAPTSMTSESGYHFDKWSDGVPDATRTIGPVSSNAHFVAEFKANGYGISKTGENVVFAPSSGTGVYDEDMTVSWGPAAEQGYDYEFKSAKVLSGNEVLTNVSAGTSLTFNMKRDCGKFHSPIKVEVIYGKTARKPHYRISASVMPSGSGEVEGVGEYEEGSYATLTATTNTGYSFSCWTNGTGIVSTENPWTFAVTGNATFTAVFTGNLVRVNFDIGDYDGDTPRAIYVTFGKPYGHLPDVDYDDPNLMFTRWLDGEGKSEVTENTTVSIPVAHTLRADNPSMRTMFDVVFVDKDGSNGAITNKNLATGTEIAPLVPATWTRQYYNLVGWDPPLPQTVGSSDLEFTAVWRSLSDVLDCTNLLFTAVGNWEICTTDHVVGVGDSCMKLPKSNGDDLLSATVTGAGTLSFNWKVDNAKFVVSTNGQDIWSSEKKSAKWAPDNKETIELTGPCELRFYGAPTEFIEYCLIDNVTWTPGVVTKKHVVTFVDPSETIKTNVVQEVEEGAAAVAPEWTSEKFDPTACGWDRDFSKIMEDITVNAVWTCRVSFVDEEGGTPTVTKHVEYDESVTAPQWSRIGYTFGGWDPSLPEKVTENITVKAVWNPIYHKVTFKDPSGTCSADPQQVAYGQGATAPKWASEKFDPTTCGWSKEFSEVMDDIEVCAVWTCRVVFVDRAGGNAPVTNKVEYGTGITEGPDFTAPADYRFGGWDPALPLTVLSNTTVSVIWTQDPMCTVTFHDPSGTFADTKSKVAVGGTVTAPDWKTGRFKSLAWNKPLGPIGADITISAVWTCEIKFVDGTFTHSPDTKEVTLGNAVAAPAWQQTGYALAGWQPAFEATASSNSAYAAVWAGNAYTVTFDAKGGSAVPEKTVTYGQPYGALADSTRAGFKFLGWWTASSGGTQVTADTPVATADNHALYARWKQDVGEVSAALDCGNLIFTAAGGWTIYTDHDFAYTAEGGDDSCLRTSSKDVGAGLTATIKESGTLSFHWKIKAGVDLSTWLDVFIGDTPLFEGPEVLKKDGTDGWQSVKDKRIEIGAGEEATLRFVCGRNCEYLAVDGVTWVPDGSHPEPTEKDRVTISYAGISADGKFSLSFPFNEDFDYLLRTNANLLIDSWGVMEIEGTKAGEIMTFEPEIIEGQPQLFYKVETIRKK